MRFLVDNQLPAALAGWLRTKAHQAEHVLEINLAQSKDSPIWHYAHKQGAAVIPKDEDFAEWVRRGPHWTASSLAADWEYFHAPPASVV